MSLLDAKGRDQFMKQIESLADETRRSIQQQFTGTPEGQVSVPDEVWATQFEAELVKSPPVPITEVSSGRTIVVSPFLFALGLDNVGGGKEDIQRYLRIRGSV